MELHNILSAQYIEPTPSTAMQLTIDATIEGEREEFIFIYRPEDSYGLSPDVNAWFADHPDFEPARP